MKSSLMSNARNSSTGIPPEPTIRESWGWKCSRNSPIPLLDVRRPLFTSMAQSLCLSDKCWFSHLTRSCQHLNESSAFIQSAHNFLILFSLVHTFTKCSMRRTKMFIREGKGKHNSWETSSFMNVFSCFTTFFMLSGLNHRLYAWFP